MKTKLRLVDAEDKESPNTGTKYSVFDTTEGKMSCFKAEIVKTLKENMGKDIEVDVHKSPDGSFQNIRKFFGEAAAVVEEEVKACELPANAKVKVTEDKFEAAREAKNTSMYTSYAKDIFIARLQTIAMDVNKEINSEDIMMRAIALVKQARDAFK